MHYSTPSLKYICISLVSDMRTTRFRYLSTAVKCLFLLEPGCCAQHLFNARQLEFQPPYFPWNAVLLRDPLERVCWPLAHASPFWAPSIPLDGILFYVGRREILLNRQTLFCVLYVCNSAWPQQEAGKCVEIQCSNFMKFRDGAVLL